MRKTVLFFVAVSCHAAFAQTEAPDSIRVQELDEIIVKGETPQINSRDGILVVDLPSIVKDKPVSNILEALGYVPGVTSYNGIIGLNGATSITILLNGELTNMPLQNLYQLLYSTPVDRLKLVEIMYAAPAKYHVSGAVINIVLKTPRAIDGLMGQTRLGYTQAHYASYGGGLAATYAQKDWTFDVNWMLTREKTRSRQETYSNHLVGGAHSMVEDDMRQIGDNISNVVYAAASLRTFKLTYNGQIKADAQSRSLANGTFGDYTNRYTFRRAPAYHNIALRYEMTFGLTVGGDYTSYAEEREQQLEKTAVQLVHAVNTQCIDRWHVFADQEHTLGKWKLNYGVEYQGAADQSRQKYFVPLQEGFDNTLRENVVDVYVGTQASVGRGLSFVASAKAEYFHNNYMHNWSFVPQLGMTYYRTPKSIFQLNFTSQRKYPPYWQLHGGTAYISDYSTIVGNLSLQPAINYSAQLSYILAQKYAATFYVLYTDRYSVQLPYQLPDRLNLLFKTVNLDFSRTIGLQLQAPFAIGNVLSSTAVVNLSNRREKATHFHDISFDNSRWSLYGSLNNSIKISASCPVSFTVEASYISGNIQGPGRFNPLWRINAGAKWQFGHKRCCELDLKCNDIFNTWNPELKIDNAGQDYKLISHDTTRNMELTFLWRFNGFKPKNTSVDTSRFGTGS